MPASTPGDIPSALRFPQLTIDASYVARPQAEVRLGPGTEYRVRDELLTQGHRVIVFERVGVWQRVQSVEDGVRGWVHYRTLDQITANQSELTLNSEVFSRVFAVRPIFVGFDFDRGAQLNLDIPKGRAFLGLAWRKQRVLVYLAETNSLLWLRREDAQ